MGSQEPEFKPVAAASEPADLSKLGRLRAWLYRVRFSLVAFRYRYLPQLVWEGDEVDVRLVFTDDTINQTDPVGGLFSGGLFEIEERMRKMGISFDRGQGFDGRDWELDWSLHGPLRVKFRRRTLHPERRARPAAAFKIVGGNGGRS